MVERTPIGQMTRRYFIKMEEAALEGDSFQKNPDKLSEEIFSAGSGGGLGADCLPPPCNTVFLSRKST